MSSIYAIKNQTSGDVYIGSTTQELRRRFSTHKSNYKSFMKGLFHYLTSFEILKCPTAYIEYIEGCDIENMLEREQYWIDNIPNCINKKNPIRQVTAEEYKKKWNEHNRDKVNKAQRIRRAKKKAMADT